ncbi:MAG: hypothetical protein E7675_01645 [Ruminococcaceae bacterium]|nr:hypothetical protein [Oscillospiraceae bacterium]
MYSRKFNGIGVLPPDYSGVALRHDTGQSPMDSSKKEEERDSVPCHPRRPVFENDSFDDQTPCKEQDPPQKPPERPNKTEHQAYKEKRSSPNSSQDSSHGRTFSLEDIMLAGLLLLLMNDDNADNGLLIIVGLLLLVGM